MELIVLKKERSATRSLMGPDGKSMRKRYRYNTVLEMSGETFPILLEKSESRGYIMDLKSGYSVGAWKYICLPEFGIGAVYDLSFHDAVELLRQNLHRLPELRKKVKVK